MTPQKETFFGTQTLFVDITDGEAENECPDQAENDFPIAINNIFCADVCKLYSSAFYKVQSFVDILEFLDAELGTTSIAT